MDKSESIAEIAKALNKAQHEMSGAVKGTDNPFFNKPYADLGSVVMAIKEAFFDNGLSYSQFPVYKDQLVGVETILMHTSGEWMKSTLLLPMQKQDPQKAGSAITYARRYALQSIAGIPSEDDDGNAATQGSQAQQASKPDYTKVIARFDALKTQAERDEMWKGITPDQRVAITDAVNARKQSK